MSLRIWLPLMGNLNNNGLENVSITNNNDTPVDTNGKLGPCYSFNGSTNSIVTSYKATDKISFCLWVYFKTTGAGHVMDGRNDNGNGYQPIYVTQNSIQIGNNVNGFASYNFDWEINRWYHICVVHDDVSGRVYVDGNLIGENASGKGYNYNTYLPITIGCRYSFTSYKSIKVNDFRIYDHALTVKEIKEIAKGLMCHYPLDGMGANRNLYNFETIIENWVPSGCTMINYLDEEYDNVLKVTATSGEKRIYRYVGNVWNQDQVYTVSFLAKADEEVSCNMSRSIANYSPNFTLSTEWKRYYGQITSTVTTSGGTLSFTILSTDIPVYITQVKLELGDKVTPYVPGEGDSSYNVLNLNNLSLPDISGITQENATIVRSVNNIINSPRYLLSTQFTHDYKSVITLPNFNFEYMDYGTLSFWINIHSFKYWSHFVFFANSFNWTGKEYDFIIVATSGNSGDTEYESKAVCLDCCSYTNSCTMSVNTWYHIVITWDAVNYVIKRYVNGILHSTNDDSTNKRLDTYRTKHNNHFLGNGYITDNNRGYFDLSDFRLYSTCLSADDIKELYNTPISISKNHNIITQGEYVEGYDKVQFNKNGIVNASGSVKANMVSGTNKGSVSSTGTSVSDGIMCYGSGGNGTCTVSADNTVPVGNYSYNITGNTSGNRDFQQRQIPYIAGKSYTGSWWAKGSGTCLYRVWDITASTQLMSKTFTLTDEWTFYSHTFTATQTMEDDNCTFHLGLTGNSEIHLCGMKLEENDHPTPWTYNKYDIGFETDNNFVEENNATIGVQNYITANEIIEI